ncbi:MAG: 2-hydroxyglutaryl-CoA dehydratase [Firmicutes bacterium]|jgi:predicted nucleotide-binding protein (sugar kinase/HSP70/actin superfamily)|nr:2-hydroxyglutaryl-CoA dehydratase [Bacillota bacterium]
MSTMRIGIPRSLFFYSYLPFWQTFWSELGYEVIVSPLTNKDILDQGIAHSATDLCVPVKIFHGHVSYLINQAVVDVLFVPRMVNVGTNDTFCPKFLALPEMINCSFSTMPAMVSPRIDVRGRLQLFKLCTDLQRQWAPKKSVWGPFEKAYTAQSQYEAQLANGLSIDQAWPTFAESKYTEAKKSLSSITSELKIAVLGYPYAVYDSFINGDVLKKLSHLGVSIVTADMIPFKKRRLHRLSKDLFWHYSNMVIQAGVFWLNQSVSGLIHITNFACGPDAMVGKMLELACKQQNKPLLTLTLDEQTGQIGINTRIEAFVDMLQRRIRYAHNLPLHG